MPVDRTDIQDALACATISKHRGDFDRPVFPYADEIAATRRQIVRFLENVPDDLSVIELREILDETPSED